MKILVVGGAGYVGSHMSLVLRNEGHEVVVLDDLSSGTEQALLGAPFVVGSIGERAVLDRVFSEHRFDGVMHFASFIQVGESMRDPARYYRNNLVHTLELLDAMVRHRVERFVFSSTAAIFGQPERVPVGENSRERPINPYGRTKLMVEHALRDYHSAYGLKSAALRYFNAAGADPSGRLGENHDPETHLIPLALQAVSGRGGALRVFGRDYDTPDGTCIRDYIHVVDLCVAHLLALEELARVPVSAYNLGNGNGFSVQQVIDAVAQVTGRAVPTVDAPRRPGDVPRLVADSTLARERLGWEPRYRDLESMVEHAWLWEQKIARPNGLQ